MRAQVPKNNLGLSPDFGKGLLKISKLQRGRIGEWAGSTTPNLAELQKLPTEQMRVFLELSGTRKQSWRE
jgi:hypothetical protein